MTLQKGRLGIGTTEPEGRLAVLDEPHNLEEFPPRAMTGYKNYFEGHGEFCVSASSEGSATRAIWKAFNKVSSSGDWWEDANYPSYTNGVYNGAGSYSLGGISGQYVIFELPYKIDLKSIGIAPRTNLGGRSPGTGVILGSNDRTNWEQIHSFSGLTYTNDTFTNININTTKKFSVFAMVVTNVAGSEANTGLQLSEMKFFGTREQGQSVLHDGQLTLTKSLNVPRIGPALDADDTPRRDRLVVEYNTSTNPTFERAVRDTSGRGFHGALFGGAHYDATEKALTFDAVTGTALESGILPLQGDASHSYSFWFNRKINGDDVLVSIATSPDVTNSASTMSNFYVTANGGGSWFHIQNDTTYPANTFTDGTWFHVVCIYKGGGASPTYKELYVNGIKITLSLSGHSTSGDPLNFTNPTLSLGGEHNGRSDYYFNGSISNFKLYDTALTAEEVKTLYDMGRNGSVANPQPLHIAAPLYSPGTVVQVEQAVKTDTQTTTSVSPIDVSGLGVTIRPKFSNSKILVSYQVNMGGNYHMFLRVFRTQNGVQTLVGTGDVVGLRPPATSYQSHLNVLDLRSMNMEFLDSANGTDAIEYKVQFWVAHEDYTAFINQSMTTANNAYYAFPSSSITVKEVCQ
jgi:hypothetical protein